MSLTTYVGIIREGRVEFTEPVTLPEGRQVYVVVPPILDEQGARRKANRWLLENVGNMVMADQASLVQQGGRVVWRFDAFMLSLAHAPWGPIGQVSVDAATGQMLVPEGAAEDMMQRGEDLARSLLPATG